MCNVRLEKPGKPWAMLDAVVSNMEHCKNKNLALCWPSRRTRVSICCCCCCCARTVHPQWDYYGGVLCQSLFWPPNHILSRDWCFPDSPGGHRLKCAMLMRTWIKTCDLQQFSREYRTRSCPHFAERLTHLFKDMLFMTLGAGAKKTSARSGQTTSPKSIFLSRNCSVCCALKVSFSSFLLYFYFLLLINSSPICFDAEGLRKRFAFLVLVDVQQKK